MNKIYELDNLNSMNSAKKIEAYMRKMMLVKSVHIDYKQKKMFVNMQGEQTEEAMVQAIHQVDGNMKVKDITKKEHEECGDRKHSVSCGHEKKKDRPMVGARKLYIKGLDCVSCASKIETHVTNMENVVDASINITTGALLIQLQEDARAEETLNKIMFAIPTLEQGLLVEKEKAKEEENITLFSFKDNWRLYVGILLFLLAIALDAQPYGPLIFLASYAFVGIRVVYTAIRNILKGEVFDENFLMSVATIGALAIRSYDEAVAVMIFYEIGEMFQTYAVHRSRKSISSLMNIRADYANKWVDGVEERVDPKDVNVGDYVLVKPGERIPLDGVVVKGRSSLDTSALTGESVPRDVYAKDDVLAGVVNLNGVLTLQVTKAYGESTVSRILDLVENASSKKAPMEKFITKFARVYTPIVVALAVALAILPPLVLPGAQFSDWLYRALTFLVVSCPCALVVSVPLGMFAGIGAASKQGILIKGGNYLEALRDIDTVVFDKTGTLTKGVFKVVDMYAQNISKDALLKVAAYGEYYSNHPIATSIKNAYQEDIDITKISDYEEIAGNGVQVTIDHKTVLLGNYKLMEANAIAYMDPKAMGTIMHVAMDHVYMGYIVINDEIKETSKQAIVALKQDGVEKCVMLSGDRSAVGEYVAETLGLDEVHMQLLPADKVEKVEALLQKERNGHKLAFVGDGINDAPVLARADVGVAMGGIGSDAAIEAADVVLMKDDPSALSDAIRIARKTMIVLLQNIIFSVAVKAVVLLLTAFGMASMWMGVFADVGVTLLAILNTMRVLKMK